MNYRETKTTIWAVSLSVPLLINATGCGLNQAPNADAELRSYNQMKELILGLRNYHVVNDGQWPDQLSDIRPVLTGTDLDALMNNSITGDMPGYEYVKPGDNGNPETTVILYQLRNGKRATDL